MDPDPNINSPDRINVGGRESKISRRKFIKRTTGTVLVFGLASSALYADAPKCTHKIISCSGGGGCVVTNCPPGSTDVCTEKKADGTKVEVPRDGKDHQYGCGKSGEAPDPD
jgi:hypothetical protein